MELRCLHVSLIFNKHVRQRLYNMELISWVSRVSWIRIFSIWILIISSKFIAVFHQFSCTWMMKFRISLELSATCSIPLLWSLFWLAIRWRKKFVVKYHFVFSFSHFWNANCFHSLFLIFNLSSEPELEFQIGKLRSCDAIMQVILRNQLMGSYYCGHGNFGRFIFAFNGALWEDTTSSLYVQSACYKLLLGPHVVMISLSKLIMCISLVTDWIQTIICINIWLGILCTWPNLT